MIRASLLSRRGFLYFFGLSCCRAKGFFSNSTVDRSHSISQDLHVQFQHFIRPSDASLEELQKLQHALEIVTCHHLIETFDPLVSNDEHLDMSRLDTRFVPASSAWAYIDWHTPTFDCVQVHDANDDTLQQYQAGMCEILPNCYWSEFMHGDGERRPVYSTKESPQALPDAMTIADARQIIEDWMKDVSVAIVPLVILVFLTVLSFGGFLYQWGKHQWCTRYVWCSRRTDRVESPLLMSI